MIAIVDIGNSAAKICEVQSGGVPGKVATIALSALDNPFEQQPVLAQATQVIIACSGDETLAARIKDGLTAAGKEALDLDRSGPVPFNSAYAPGQAGIDRLANVAAAINEIGFPAIVVDAGSAVTLEAVSADGVFLGGAILPGFGLQATALHSGTASLPEVTLSAATPTLAPTPHPP
jgi:type III pantothenate kinase